MFKFYHAWARVGLDAWTLGMDASSVIQLRTAKIAGGGAGAAAEAQLMVSEKLKAGLQLQSAVLAGALGSSPLSGTQAVLDHYRPKVAANRRRLRRGIGRLNPGRGRAGGGTAEGAARPRNC